VVFSIPRSSLPHSTAIDQSLGRLRVPPVQSQPELLAGHSASLHSLAGVAFPVMKNAPLVLATAALSLALSLMLPGCASSPSKDSKTAAPDSSAESTASQEDGSSEGSEAPAAASSGDPEAAPAEAAPDRAPRDQHFKGPPDNPEGGLLLKDPETGCGLRGPAEGELLGEPLGDPADFDVAAARCMELGEACRGVSSEWYLGMPWVPIGEGEEFRQDEMSYARTFLRACPRPSEAPAQ